MIILTPCIIGHYIFPLLVASMRENNAPILSRIIVNVLLVQTLPYFLTGFVAFGFLRYLFSKLDLDNAEALGKEFQPQDDEPFFADEGADIELV